MPAAALALLLVLAAGGAAAQPYPHKTVVLVTHSSPGGGSDVFLRVLAKHLGPKMGVAFAVENVSGGAGSRAVARVAQAPADGSVLYATTPTYIQTTLLSKPRHGYDSLMPVVNVFFDPEVLYVRAEAAAGSLGAVLEQARRNPGRARWGASTPASLERITMVRLNRIAFAGAVVVSHEGGGDQMIGVLNGTYDLGIGELQELRSQLEARKIRLVATLTPARLPLLPDLPTAKEQGFDITVTKFRGLAGPKNLPPPVLAAWARGIETVLADPAYRREYERDGLIPAFMAHEQAGKFTAGFAAELGASLRELGIVR